MFGVNSSFWMPTSWLGLGSSLVMFCKKCKQSEPLEGDSWCLGCSAHESLGQDLAARWHSKALRAAANDLVLYTVKAVRSLRSISSSLQSAESARATQGAGSERGATPKAAGIGRSLPPPPPPPCPVKEQPAESDLDEYEESGEEESELEEDRPEVKTASSKARAARPPEPERPPTQEQLDRNSQSHRRRSRSTPRKKRRHSGKTRGGSKHQKLYRQLDKPDLVLHRRLPSSYIEEPASRGGRAALERRK